MTDEQGTRGLALQIASIPNRRLHWLRVGLWVLVAVTLVGPTVQAQIETARRDRAKRAATKPQDALAVGKDAKGALTRWRTAVEEFWAGRNIYVLPPAVTVPRPSQRTCLHPNMPFTVILLTPLARLPVWAMVLAWNLLKIAAVIGSLFMLARVVAPAGRRVPDWVMLLAFAWAATFIAGDLQHANTNCFVLAALVAHLWLYRRGADYFAGVPLALAVCIKLTPALFLAYWLWQRNVRLLIGAVLSLAAFMLVVPLMAVGPERTTELTLTWYRNLIGPGLGNRAYPVHINQSIPGLFQRLLIGPPQKEGDINWNSDDDPYYLRRPRPGKPADEIDPPEWIALVNLSPAQAQGVIRVAQAAVVLLGLWGIGWRALPRDDGRRGLHYAMIVLGMMLLNQRTWDHHATVLLIAAAGIWYALYAGNFALHPRARAWALWLTIAAGLINWLNRGDLFKGLSALLGYGRDAGERWGNLFDAYGPLTLHFLLLFAAALILSVSLRRADPAYISPDSPPGA